MSLPATEAASPRFAGLETWPPEAALAALWESQMAAVAQVGGALPALANAAAAALPRLQAGGRLVYCGAGTSGRLAAQDGAELSPTFGWPAERLVVILAGGPEALHRAREGAEDDEAAARAAIAEQHVGASDVVIGVAASGTTRFTRAALEAARLAGALTIGIANSPGAPLLAEAACPVLLATGAEALAGSTRLGAGTAQKVALNLLSTLLMLGLGRVHRGRMIGLVASNAKLRARANRLLQELDGCTETAARDALEAARGRVPVALLLRRGLDVASAEALLARHGDNFTAALAELDQ